IDATNSICAYSFEACPDSLAYHAKEDDLTFAKRVDKDYLPTPVHLTVLETPSVRVKDADPKTALRSEAVAVAEEIVRLLHSDERLANGRPIRAGDIAVLMRSMGMAGDLVKALRAYNVDSSYAPRENLAAHPHMTMMVDLLSVIDNPHDDVPLMGLLGCDNSPIPLTDVLSARGETTKSASLYDDLCAAVEQDSSVAWSEETRRAMRSFCEHLARWRAWAATLPVDRLLRKLYAEPFLAPLINTPALVALYDHARNYQNASFCGLYQFLQYFRRLLDSPDGLSIAGLKENNDAVQIMSIHKSKGLEYPVVFVCNCAKKFNERDQKAAVTFDRDLGAATQLFNPDTATQESSLTRRAIARCIDERATEEEMRLLYVAMTRARERLYLTAQLSQSRFDTVRKRAEAPTRGNRYATLSVNNYLDWILSGIYAPDATIPEHCVELTVLNKDLYTHPHPMEEVLSSSVPTEATDDGVQADAKPDVASADEQFYRAVLAHHATYDDPRALLRTLPTKAAASKLRAAMLDGRWLAEDFGGDTEGAKARTEETALSDTEASIRRRIELMQGRRPAFDELLAEGERATPAERGTATHLFLQYCDVKRLARIGVESEIARLVEDGFLTKRAAGVLRREQLDAFLASDLFTLLSKPETRIWRELHFDRFIPYRTLTRNAALAERLEDYTLYVQGSIDLIVEESDGTLWLFDYKTDHIRDSGEAEVKEQLLGDHADQLRIYAKAVEGLFGRRPDHVSIYSLPLGQSVELTSRL
ncbi:MAG: PD-(D/E)XK nuclease family protein, partial [Clostridia bacterium]|nr:PD-(D/E)XK nuclease family protein [Clostridia bacterium]